MYATYCQTCVEVPQQDTIHTGLSCCCARRALLDLSLQHRSSLLACHRLDTGSYAIAHLWQQPGVQHSLYSGSVDTFSSIHNRQGQHPASTWTLGLQGRVAPPRFLLNTCTTSGLLANESCCQSCAVHLGVAAAVCGRANLWQTSTSVAMFLVLCAAFVPAADVLSATLAPRLRLGSACPLLDLLAASFGAGSPRRHGRCR